MGFESFGPAVEAGQALNRIKAGPRQGGDSPDWIRAVGEFAMTMDPLPHNGALDPKMRLLEFSGEGSENERQSLAAISMVCPSERLEKCLTYSLARVKNHRKPAAGWTPWPELETQYKEVLIWTLGTLADRICFESVRSDSLSSGTTNLFWEALGILKKVQEDKKEFPGVRELAREGQMDLENSNLYGTD
jgi:hypothetical protein